MDVAKRIVFYRKKRGLKTNKLANLAGISQSYLRDVELGNKNPTVEYLSYICDALNISLSEFFSDEEKDNDILNSINKLNEKQKEALLQFLKTLDT